MWYIWGKKKLLGVDMVVVKLVVFGGTLETFEDVSVQLARALDGLSSAKSIGIRGLNKEECRDIDIFTCLEAGSWINDQGPMKLMTLNFDEPNEIKKEEYKRKITDIVNSVIMSVIESNTYPDMRLKVSH